MEPRAQWQDLGLIKVKTVGSRDIVYLGHNDEEVVVVNCPVKRPATAQFLKAFYELTPFQMRQVSEVYLAWKREVCPNFRPAMTKPGHPWQHSLQMAERKRRFFGEAP